MISRSKQTMTADRFVEYIQNCYNDRFHEDLKKTIIGFLRKYDERFLSCLARITLMRHPRQYRTAPGLAELIKYSEEARAEYQATRQDLTIPAIEERDVLTDDERAQIGEAIARLKDKVFSRD